MGVSRVGEEDDDHWFGQLESLDPATTDDDAEFVRVKYHKDQANEKDYSHQGVGFTLKKWQADHVPGMMDEEVLKEFEVDKGASKEGVRKYGSRKSGGETDAPVKTFGGAGDEVGK